MIYPQPNPEISASPSCQFSSGSQREKPGERGGVSKAAPQSFSITSTQDQVHDDVATFARELQKFISQHVQKFKFNGLINNPSTSLRIFNPEGPPQPLSGNFDEAINLLVTARDQLFILEEEKISVHGSEGPSSNGNDLLCMYRRFCCLRETLSPEVLEIADYCYSEFEPSEVLFDSAEVSVSRSNMLSMDHTVINAWARVLMSFRMNEGLGEFVYLKFIENMLYINDDMLINDWRKWIESCKIDLDKAKLIFIPMAVMGHYYLVAVNFEKEKIQCYDTIHNEWNRRDAFTIAKVSCLSRIHGDSGGKRYQQLASFSFEVINPAWNAAKDDPESRLYVMYLMDLHGCPEVCSQTINLQDECYRAQLRILLCSSIVLSDVNLEKQAVQLHAKAITLIQSNLLSESW